MAKQCNFFGDYESALEANGNGPIPETEPIHKIEDKKANNYFCLHLHDQKTLDDFTEKSGMRNKGAEYQHHYWAAVGRLILDGEIMDIVVPLALFNYKQGISSAHITFHLEDVEEASEKASKIAEKAFDEFSKGKTYKAVEKAFSGLVEWSIVSMNSIHRHPSGLFSFSGTDYKKNPMNPGVCFPLGHEIVHNHPNCASIVVHKGGHTELAHTEGRIAQYSPKTKTITYFLGTTVSYVRGYQKDETGPIAKLFNVEGDKVKSYFTKDTKKHVAEGSPIETIIDVWENDREYNPDTSMIDKDNVVDSTKAQNQMFGTLNGTKGKQQAEAGKKPMFMMGKIYYNGRLYDDDEIEMMRSTLIETSPKSLTKIYTLMKAVDVVDEFMADPADIFDEDGKLITLGKEIG